MRLLVACSCLLLVACARPVAFAVDPRDASAAVGGNAADAAPANDLRRAGDLALPIDAGANPPPDLARGSREDMAKPADLAAPSDLRAAPDLRQVPDLASSDMTTNTCASALCKTSSLPLTNGCHWCVTEICKTDNYCCVNHWSSICVAEVGSICKLTCP